MNLMPSCDGAAVFCRCEEWVVGYNVICLLLFANLFSTHLSHWPISHCFPGCPVMMVPVMERN